LVLGFWLNFVAFVVDFIGADGDAGFEDNLFEGLVLLVEGFDIGGARGYVAVWLDYPDVNVWISNRIFNYCAVSLAGDLLNLRN